MKGSAHGSFPLLHDRFTLELFTKNDEMTNPHVYMLCSDYPRIIQRNNYHASKNNANIYR